MSFFSGGVEFLFFEKHLHIYVNFSRGTIWEKVFFSSKKEAAFDFLCIVLTIYLL